MLRITPRESAASAKAYYTEEARQDYYSQGQEILGNWGGQGAARLGLAGQVDREAFIALCDNLNPHTGEPLTPRMRVNRTCGYDLNFNCPKSVSLVYAWNEDERIVQAFQESVRETMEQLETLMQTRVRKNGHTDGNRPTGNLVWAEFIHHTARPEADVPDPHLHEHCFAFNATFDPEEQIWKAGQFRNIKLKAPYYEAIFMTLLSGKLAELGYATRPVGRAFEIVGVPDAVSRQFSKRTRRIEKTAAELGITDDKDKDKLGAMTRKVKKSLLPMNELRRLWKEALPEEYREAMDRFVIRPTVAIQPADPSVLREALDRSILHNFDRASVVAEEDILAHAMRLAYGSRLTLQAMRQAMLEHPEFIIKQEGPQKWVTTYGVLAEEQRVIQWVREGMGTREAMVDRPVLGDSSLSAEQRAAVLHVLNSRDRVTAIEGKSGAGKTRLMLEAVRLIQAEHLPVLVMAPGTQAVQETLRAEGFADAQTVEQLLVNPRLQDQYRHGIWWVDEAGQLSARAMSRLFALAEQKGARIVLTGDVGQHRAVERGDGLRLLYEHADLKPAMLTQIQRQRGTYKQVVELLAAGQVRQGMELMDQQGWIHEMPFETRYKALADLYVQSADEGARPLVVCPTHAEGRLVTDQIRATYKAQGDLGKERQIPILRSVDLSPADKEDHRSYRPGWIIELIQATPGTQAGTRMTVHSIDEDGLVFVKKPDGTTRRWDIQEYADRFQVFERDTLPLAPGDRIRITKNGKPEYSKSKVANGSHYTLTGFDEFGDLKLAGGLVLSKDYAHLDHGYYTTSHGAQSKTVNHVIVAESSMSLGAASREQVYVSLSRGRRRVDLFTDNKEGLFDAVEASSRRRSATELVADKPLPEDYHLELRKAQERAEQRMNPHPAKASPQRTPAPQRTEPASPKAKSVQPKATPVLPQADRPANRDKAPVPGEPVAPDNAKASEEKLVPDPQATATPLAKQLGLKKRVEQIRRKKRHRDPDLEMEM